MRIYFPDIAITNNRSLLKITSGPKSKINFLIIAHLLVFILHAIIKHRGFADSFLTGGTIDDFIKSHFTVSANTNDIISYWGSGILTYQFIHFNNIEFFLSISMLWLFGHILQNKLGQFRVVLLYFGFSILSVLIFYLAHQIFPIFAGSKGIMQGAFGGVLGIMSTTVFLYGKYRLQLNKHFSIQLWKLFLIVLVLGLTLLYENNIAYLLVYGCSIYAGKKCADVIQEKNITRQIKSLYSE